MKYIRVHFAAAHWSLSTVKLYKLTSTWLLFFSTFHGTYYWTQNIWWEKFLRISIFPLTFWKLLFLPSPFDLETRRSVTEQLRRESATGFGLDIWDSDYSRWGVSGFWFSIFCLFFVIFFIFAHRIDIYGTWITAGWEGRGREWILGFSLPTKKQRDQHLQRSNTSNTTHTFKEATQSTWPIPSKRQHKQHPQRSNTTHTFKEATRPTPSKKQHYQHVRKSNSANAILYLDKTYRRYICISLGVLAWITPLLYLCLD